MPRKSRIDAAGALHHIIVRGIARKKVFDDNADRDFFIDRLGLILSDTSTQCLAWALIPNHFHLLLKTGATPHTWVVRRQGCFGSSYVQKFCGKRYRQWQKTRAYRWRIDSKCWRLGGGESITKGQRTTKR